MGADTIAPSFQIYMKIYEVLIINVERNLFFFSLRMHNVWEIYWCEQFLHDAIYPAVPVSMGAVEIGLRKYICAATQKHAASVR